jgi:predicted metal-dependent hydrolase
MNTSIAENHTHVLTVGHLTVEIIKKDIKNIHLSVHPPEGWVRLAAPLGCSDEAIRLYIISRMGWIKRQQAQFTAQERQLFRQYVARESHYFQGQRHLLRVHAHDGVGYVEIKNKGYIDLYARPESSVEDKKKILQEWYRRELKAQVKPLIEKWQAKMNLELTDWGIKRMKTKWGTCNIKAKRMWLNLELAKKPVSCVEYIIVHELIHLLERHHNDQFVAYLDSFMPQWRAHKAELNRLALSYEEW